MFVVYRNLITVLACKNLAHSRGRLFGIVLIIRVLVFYFGSHWQWFEGLCSGLSKLDLFVASKVWSDYHNKLYFTPPLFFDNIWAPNFKGRSYKFHYGLRENSVTSRVRPSPLSTPTPLVLEVWNLTRVIVLIVMGQKIPTRFLIFCLEAEKINFKVM